MKANRWTQYKFSNGKVAKNRVVVPPMASQTADSQGHVTNKTFVGPLFFYPIILASRKFHNQRDP